MKNADPGEIGSVIDAADAILVVSHMNPDADAFGSSLGLSAVLRASGKTVSTLNVDGPSDRFDCIPGMDSVQTAIPAGEWEVVIAVDAATAERLGDTFSPLVMQAAPTIINIDHHISNTRYGTLNYVIATASSTCEILASLTQRLGWELPQEAAQAFLAGIYGDTGGFKYASTSIETFAIAQQLIAAGAVPHEIAADLFGRKRLSAVRLHADALLQLEQHAAGQLVVAMLDEAAFARCNATHEDAEGLVEEMRDIDGVRIAALAYWFGDCWKVSMRSVHESLNVSEVAKNFGGGGHKQAAAFRWRREKQVLHDSLVSVLTELLQRGA
jgi:phosphoesterase RecJ-like protein